MTRHLTIGIGLAALLAGLAVYTLPGFRGESAPAAPRIETTRNYADPKILPHKAIYKIEMISKRSSAQVLNISGEMFFALKSTCDAWTTDHRFNLLYEYADSAPMRITSDFTTYESHTGDNFDFNSRRRRDGVLYEELRGLAMITDGAGTADYTLPQDLEFGLPEGTLFPMAHTASVLRVAREGKKFFGATIFDGSDEEGPAEVTAFIGKPVNAMAQMAPSAAIDTALLNTPAWRMRLAFFPLSSAESEADYEMDIVLHDNGVISDMVVDYKDFSVTQKLVALEALPAVPCGQPHDRSRIKP
ncbi:MAG: cell envelope integrity EipB family protein [Micavibrio aeruginosavorus]|nr:cell envelope integrity EipB family protein [Micavibrio aeruginosavorus]